MKWEGFAYAAAAAVGHSCIDASRKLASQRFTSLELVGLVGFMDAIILSSVVFGAGLFNSHAMLQMEDADLFAGILLGSAGIKVLVNFMYQRALHVSPLSVTVPYLAFTPVLLVFTGYMIMRETPSSQGLLGVVVVTMGGYLLAIEKTEEADLKKVKGLKPPPRSENLLASVIPRSAAPASKASERISWQGGLEVAGNGEESEQMLVIVDEDEAALKSTLPLVVNKAASRHLSYWLSVGHILDPLMALKREEGSLLMLGVAGLLSISNSVDKLGAHMAPSFIVFAALQRVVMAIPVVLYLAFTSPMSFMHLFRHFPTMLAISIFECVAIACYLKSLETLLVAYSIAAKRSNVLLSVIIGHVIFKERIWKRLPYVLLMLVGMVLILFA